MLASFLTPNPSDDRLGATIWCEARLNEGIANPDNFSLGSEGGDMSAVRLDIEVIAGSWVVENQRRNLGRVVVHSNEVWKSLKLLWDRPILTVSRRERIQILRRLRMARPEKDEKADQAESQE